MAESKNKLVLLDQTPGVAVRYDNSFNKTGLTMFTRTQQNVLFAIFSKINMRLNEKTSFPEFYGHFTPSELRELVSQPNLKTNDLTRIVSTILDTKVRYYENKDFHIDNVFAGATIGENDSYIDILLSPYMASKFLLGEDGQYTLIDIEDFIKLRSPYSKELYRMLRQFRHTGVKVIPSKEFRKHMNISSAYSDYKVITKYILPAIKELAPYFKKLRVNVRATDLKLPKNIKFSFEKHSQSKVSPQSGRDLFELIDNAEDKTNLNK